jgi:uncharacterized membrane protein YheB (UPF0754 family)
MSDTLAIKLVAVPIISALTGYATNYVAVRMLFRPRAPIRVFGVPLQGLIPRRRSQIAQAIGQTVEEHLISHDDIRKIVTAPGVQEKIETLLRGRVEGFLSKNLASIHPMAAMFVNDKMIARMRDLIMEELLQTVPELTEQVMDKLEEDMNFRNIVVEKIENFDLDRFESILLKIASKELRAIEVLGGVLGLFIGLLTDLLLFI